MDKIEFKNMCHETFLKLGFRKVKKGYYLEGDKEIDAQIFITPSTLGKAYFICTCLSVKGYNDRLPYPTFYETDMKMRLTVPGKQEVVYDAGEGITDYIEYGLYDSNELEKYIEEGIRYWALNAVNRGAAYILKNWERYEPILPQDRAPLMHFLQYCSLQ